MRCGCPNCETFMVQQEASLAACICPACGYRCNACLGTGTVISRERLAALRGSVWFTPAFDGAPEEETGEADFNPEPPDAPEGF